MRYYSLKRQLKLNKKNINPSKCLWPEFQNIKEHKTKSSNAYDKL